MNLNLEPLLQWIANSLEKLVELSEAKLAQPTCKYTMFAWLDEWFSTYRAPVLKDHGYDLRNYINKHVKPNIDDRPLNEYTAHDISKALNAISSSRMRQIVRQIYDQSFREAVRAGYIDRNPVDNIDGIKHKYDHGRTLELVEEAELLQAVANHKLAPLFKFYLLTGARPSEALAVKWADVKLNTIRLPGTKTDLSDRTLPISDKLRALLDSIDKTDERLFPYTYANVRYHFEKLREKLSFDMTLKDLRHTFGMRCLEAGVSMKTVQKWLGHSNYGTTANIYSHITTDFECEEVKKLDRSNM